jgi:hypothetical protein
MVKLIVKDLDLFDSYLNSISKLVDSCKFTINSEECTVMAVDEKKIFRAFFKTNSLVSDTPVEFCLGELMKFCRSISTLRDFKGEDNTVELQFDGNFLKLKDKIKFSLKTIKEEVITRFIGSEIKATLEPVFGFTVNNVLMKKLNSMSFISRDEDSHRVYLYKEDDKIIGEIDNKNATIRDSIAIPITSDFYGEWSAPIVTKLDYFRLWNLLNAKEIKVDVVKQGVCIIVNEIAKSDFYVKIKIVSPVIKK